MTSELNGTFDRRLKNTEICLLVGTDYDNDNGLKKLLLQYFNHEFNQPIHDKSEMISVHRMQAIRILEDLVRRTDDRLCEMELPWTSVQPNLPSNRSMVEHRLQCLKIRLAKDESLTCF